MYRTDLLQPPFPWISFHRADSSRADCRKGSSPLATKDSQAIQIRENAIREMIVPLTIVLLNHLLLLSIF
jgi:hypothetical protein